MYAHIVNFKLQYTQIIVGPKMIALWKIINVEIFSDGNGLKTMFTNFINNDVFNIQLFFNHTPLCFNWLISLCKLVKTVYSNEL